MLEVTFYLLSGVPVFLALVLVQHEKLAIIAGLLVAVMFLAWELSAPRGLNGIGQMFVRFSAGGGALSGVGYHLSRLYDPDRFSAGFSAPRFCLFLFLSIIGGFVLMMLIAALFGR